MKLSLATILALCLLVAPAEARRRKSVRKGKSRAVVRECPPPVVRILPDVIRVIPQDEEAALQSAIAAWMAGQPPMNDAASNKAREIAAKWYRLGRESARTK